MRYLVARRLLSLFVSGENADAVLGDLEEELVESHRSRLWFWGQVISVSVAHWRERASERRPRAELRRRAGAETVASFFTDVRHGARGLLSSPGFTVVAASTLALGIGAVTALFSIAHGVLLSPLPYPEPDRIVRVWNADADDPLDGNPLSSNEVHEYGERNRAFAGFAGFDYSRLNLAGADEPRRLLVARVESSFFDVLAVSPVLGRTFTEQEDVPGVDDVAVLSHRLWQSAFGGRKDVIGRNVDLGGRARTVIGVAPPDLDLPHGVDLFVPMAIDVARLDAETMLSHGKSAIARLADGITLERAAEDLERVIQSLEDDYPGHFDDGARALLVPLREAQVGGVRPAIVALMGAVIFLLLIACANVAGLVLVRGELRRAEIAVKAALGASRRRITRGLFIESLLLAVLGGALGVAVAAFTLRTLLLRIPGSLPRIETVALDTRVLLFSIALSLATAILFGLLPALEAGRASLDGRLRERLRLSGSSHRLRRLFVTGQIALALVLLSGAGLMLRTFQGLLAVDPGVASERRLTFDVALPEAEYVEASRVALEYDRLIERLEAVSGVARVGAVSWLPFASYPSNWSVEVEGRDYASDDERPLVDYALVTGDYFGAVGIPVLAGRGLLAEDRDVAGVALSEKAAQTLFPGENPIGKRVRLHSDSVFRTVVGVVADHRNRSLEREPKPGMYLPHVEIRTGKPFVARDMTFVVETRGAPASFVGPVTDAMREVAPNLPVSRLRTMEDVLSGSVSGKRFTLEILGMFAIVGLALGAIGIYGVVASLVNERRREIALRVALGATGGDVRRLVVGSGLRLVLGGVLGGVVLAYLAARALMAELLFAVEPGDPATTALVVLVLAAAALVAILLPARRALRVDPAVTLRSE